MLVRRAARSRGILVGCHGYLENAAIQMKRLESIPGAEDWTLISVQGLHRVYRGRSQEVVASWMTSEDRETAIADNVAYVASAVRLVPRDAGTPVVYAGFSQGGSMAFRAAVRGDAASAGVISVGSDVPPELLADTAARFPRVFFATGERDQWFTRDKHDAGVAALQARGVDVEALVADAGHDWTPEISAAAAAWLERLL